MLKIDEQIRVHDGQKLYDIKTRIPKIELIDFVSFCPFICNKSINSINEKGTIVQEIYKFLLMINHTKNLAQNLKKNSLSIV